MDLEGAVRAAAGGDIDAFAEITRRFQHIAFGYALSFVRDLGHAEDVVQEAFVAAWYALSSLDDPAAFAGWLRGIVRHRAHRVLRRKHLQAMPLAAAQAVAADEPGPDRQVSADLARIGIYPTVDPLISRSRLLETGRVDRAHVELVARIREAFRVCREILDGRHDALPTEAFYFTGGWHDVLARAAQRGASSSAQ
jgi:RNA polymerase sigma factor (sigma-70 family)